MKTSAKIRELRVLMLAQPTCDEQFGDWLAAHAEVSHVDTVEDALQALRSSTFDLVVSRAEDFIPLQGVHSGGQAAAIIDSVSQGIAIVRQSGELDWANPMLLSFSQEVRDRVRDCCMETWSWAKSLADAGSKQIRGRRFSFTVEGHQRFEIAATPVVDLHNRIQQVAAVVWDVTSTVRLQDQIDAIDRAGRELLSLDTKQFARLNPTERLGLLEQKIMRCTHDHLHFENFDIRVIDKATNRLEAVLSAGTPPANANIELYAEVEGSGISGYVAARGKSYICPNVDEDSRFIRGVPDAKSSLTVALTLHDRVIGVANFESDRIGAFSEDDRQFAEIFGRYIALALHILELLVSERRETTGQIGSDVMAEITGPLNDILTDTEGLVEDYIGHDDLRKRLREISENAVRIRDSIKELTTTRPGVVGVRRAGAKHQDDLLTGKRILLADDEEVIRETVRDVLAGYGCIVQTASTGSVAIEKVRSMPFDLVLTDIKMPEASGYEVFAAAKEIDATTPVILTTGFGYDPNHSIIRARREGLAAVLFKPFKVDQLLGELRNALKALAK